MQCSMNRLFEQLVGTSGQRQRDSDAERLGGLQVDRQLVFVRQLDWEIVRLLAQKAEGRLLSDLLLSDSHGGICFLTILRNQPIDQLLTERARRFDFILQYP